MSDHGLRVVMVDDEPPARELLRGYLRERDDVAALAEAEDGPAAVTLIRSMKPDVVFLDVHMPGLDGFDVVAQIADLLPAPRIVFITAYDKHAVRAFEVNAVDYLLKPVARARFDSALDRCLASAAPPATLAPLLEDVARFTPQRLVIRDRGRIVLQPVATVDRLEAEGDYVRVHVGGKSHLVEKTLSDMEVLLAPHGFVRIHRRTLVNLERVKELHAEGSGRYRLFLADGTELVVSRSYSHMFRGQLL